MSLLPWLKAKPEAVKTCIQLNIKNADQERFALKCLMKIKVAIHTAVPTIAMIK